MSLTITKVAWVIRIKETQQSIDIDNVSYTVLYSQIQVIIFWGIIIVKRPKEKDVLQLPVVNVSIKLRCNDSL